MGMLNFKHTPQKNEGHAMVALTVFAELHDSTESGDSLRWLPPSINGR